MWVGLYEGALDEPRSPDRTDDRMPELGPDDRDGIATEQTRPCPTEHVRPSHGRTANLGNTLPEHPLYAHPAGQDPAPRSRIAPEVEHLSKAAVASEGRGRHLRLEEREEPRRPVITPGPVIDTQGAPDTVSRPLLHAVFERLLLESNLRPELHPKGALPNRPTEATDPRGDRNPAIHRAPPHALPHPSGHHTEPPAGLGAKREPLPLRGEKPIGREGNPPSQYVGVGQMGSHSNAHRRPSHDPSAEDERAPVRDEARLNGTGEPVIACEFDGAIAQKEPAPHSLATSQLIDNLQQPDTESRACTERARAEEMKVHASESTPSIARIACSECRIDPWAVPQHTPRAARTKQPDPRHRRERMLVRGVRLSTG